MNMNICVHCGLLIVGIRGKHRPRRPADDEHPGAHRDCVGVGVTSQSPVTAGGVMPCFRISANITGAWFQIREASAEGV